MGDTKKAGKHTAATDEAAEGWSEAELAAMKEHAQELKADKRRGGRASKEDDASALLAKIAEMSASDRAMAQRVHEVVTRSAPQLSPKLWYGMPAYYHDGKAVCKGKWWLRDQAEPEAWSLEMTDSAPQKSGSPGLFGNTQTTSVYVDNLSVVPND